MGPSCMERSLFLLLPLHFLFVRALPASTKRYTRFQRDHAPSLEPPKQVQETHEPRSSVTNFLSSGPPLCGSNRHKPDLLIIANKISHCLLKLSIVCDCGFHIPPHPTSGACSLFLEARGGSGGVFLCLGSRRGILSPPRFFVPLTSIRNKK